MPLRLGDVLPDNFKWGDSQVSKLMWGDELLWPLAAPYLAPVYTFDGANGADVGSDWTVYTNTASWWGGRPVIQSNGVRAGAPTSTSEPNRVAFGVTLNDTKLNYIDRRVEAVLSGAPSLLNICLVLRATDDGSKSVQLNVVSAEDHAAISTQEGMVPTPRALYTPGLVQSGDTCGIECYTKNGVTTYTGYRIRSGSRIDLCEWRDSTGIIPVDGTANKYGFLVTAERTSVSNVNYGPSWTELKAWDLVTPVTWPDADLEDLFNRSNGALGASWGFLNRGFANSVPQIISTSQARAGQPTATSGNNATTAGLIPYIADTLDTDDMETEVVLAGALSSTVQIGVLNRLNESTGLGIGTVALSNNVYIFSFSGTGGATGTQRAALGAAPPKPFVSGDTYGLRSRGNSHMAFRRTGDTWRTAVAWEDTGGIQAKNSSQRRAGMLLSASRNAGGTTYGPPANQFNSRDLVSLVPG